MPICTKKESKRMIREINQIKGLHALETNTNFVLVNIEKPKKQANNLFSYLNKKGLIVRKGNEFEGLSEKYFRITINTKENNNKLLNALKSFKS